MWRFFAIAACVLALTGCPMEISTIEQLQLIGNDPAYPLDGDYVLTQDIDASDTVNWNDGAGFEPIGRLSTPFTGTLDGNGYSIDGLVISRPLENEVALFAAATGNIKNVEVIGTITGNGNVACICAIASGSISFCVSGGTVTGTQNVGGAIGTTYFAGGDAPDINNSWADVAVIGSGMNVGGFVGIDIGNYTSNCYSIGSVTNSGSYASTTGGFCGYGGPLVSCYYDSETSGQSDTGKGVPKTTAEMKQRATFVGWDFDDTWAISATLNDGYPYLLWPEPVSMVVSPVDFITGGEANSIVFNVVTTAEWEVASDSAWAVVSPTTGSGNATITVACAVNTGDARDAIITVTGVYTDPEFINIAVTQMAFAEPDLLPPLPLQPSNMPTSSVASAYYDEYVTLYRQSSLNDENEPEYTPYTLLCRLDRKTHRITDGSGLQVTCSHVMLCDTEIDPVTDYIVTAALDKLIPKEVLEHKDFAASHYEVWLV